MRSVRPGLPTVRSGLRNRRSVRTDLQRQTVRSRLRNRLRSVRPGRLQEALLRQEVPLHEGSLLRSVLRPVRPVRPVRPGLRTVRPGSTVRSGLQMIERTKFDERTLDPILGSVV